jgi:hypothetical protein
VLKHCPRHDTARKHDSRQQLNTSTNQLTSLEVSGDDVQLVRFKHQFGLDIQAVHTRVDGKRVRDHGFLMLDPSEMRDLRRLLSAAVSAAGVAAVDKPVRSFRRAAA